MFTDLMIQDNLLNSAKKHQQSILEHYTSNQLCLFSYTRHFQCNWCCFSFYCTL